jgi:hypothetical protein
VEGLNLEEFFFLLSLTGLLPPLRDGPDERRSSERPFPASARQAKEAEARRLYLRSRFPIVTCCKHGSGASLTMAVGKSGNLCGPSSYPGNENKIVAPDYRSRARKRHDDTWRTRQQR